MKAVPLIAVVFALALVFERSNPDTDFGFWSIVAAGIVGVVLLMNALRSRGGIGATSSTSE